jgi:hypothetical protein
MIVDESTKIRGNIIDNMDSLLAYCKDMAIKPIGGRYYMVCLPDSSIIKVGLSRWHLQQERVRSRGDCVPLRRTFLKMRKKNKKEWSKNVKMHFGGLVSGRTFKRMLIGESALIGWDEPAIGLEAL